MNRQEVIIGGMGAILLTSMAIGLYSNHANRKRINELESQLTVLRAQEQRSAVDRRVSKQMEEIAYGQQALSEERSQEAIHQSEIAHKMTILSEAERKKALVSQGIAERAAAEAMAAYQMAERQRSEADEQRRQAEHAKLVTDTLNYISLGRTLGSQSYSIYQTGDTEVGNMLAYTSYLYTSDYGGDLYTPSVFQTLTQSAGSRRSWSSHNGSISRIDILPNNGGLLTVSTYGEIFAHKMLGERLTTTPLMNDKNFCFRDVYAAKDGKGYAISNTGHLVIINGGKTRIVTIENVDKPFNLQAMNDGRQLLIIGENSAALLDIATDRILGKRRLPFRIIYSGRRDYKPLLFDNRGGMHLVNSLDDMTNEKTGVEGQVTAFASSKNEHLAAYGMYDGTIWLIDSHGKKHKLVGHLSQVTKLKLNGKRLYSSSYDGKLLFWMTSDQQIKPITLFQSGSWLNDFVFSTDKDNIWTGEQNGTVTEYLISLPKIAQRLRQNINRNFTQEEWNYYVGKGIPYRKVKN
jgi:hypothetical protein